MIKKVLRGFPPHMEKKIKKSAPLFLGIHLKPICNFRCQKCFIGEQKRLKGLNKVLSLQEIFKIMEKAKKEGAKVLGLTGAGEPLLDNRFEKIVKKAKELGFITHMPTNCSTLDEKKIKFLKENDVTLILSLDSLNKKQFIDLTRTNEKIFDNVIKNIKLAQEIYKGSKKTLKRKNKKIEIYRLGIHATITNKNVNQIKALKELVEEDTLLSLSPMAYEGFATCNFDQDKINKLRDDLLNVFTEKHIVITKDKNNKKDICGFFRYGIDMNFDGQLLLDAHCIESRKVLRNIRDFNYNIKDAFSYLNNIKNNFIKDDYLSGFCPVRSPRLKEWISVKKEIYEDSKKYEKEIIKDVKSKNSLLKYAYIGDGTKRFLDVLESPEYHTYKNEIFLINKSVHQIQNIINENIVVLGVGNGKKLTPLLSKIPKKNVTLVDISKKLLDITAFELRGHFKPINQQFEKLNWAKCDNNSSFLMLGGTLANMNDWDKFILKISKKFPGKNIILGLEFISLNNSKHVKKIINEYDNDTGFNFVFNSLSILGFVKSDGHLEVSFNYNKNRIEEYFVLNDKGKQKAKKLGLNHNKILLNISIKFDKEEFYKKIHKLGFKIKWERHKESNYLIEIQL